jgi:uncharacterized protein
MSKPAPSVNDATRPFWTAGIQEELRMQRCLKCSHIRFPVGPVCTQCLSSEAEWVPVSLEPEVLAHLVFHRGYDANWKEEVPYSVVMVQFPEGPRMFLDVVDPKKQFVDRDLVGTKVKIAFDMHHEGIAIPRATVPGPLA